MHSVCEWHEGMKPTKRVATPGTLTAVPIPDLVVRVGQVWRGDDGYMHRVVAVTTNYAHVRYAYKKTAPPHMTVLAWFKEWELVTDA